MNNLLKFLSVFCLVPLPAFAAPLSFTVNMSEAVTVDTSGGTPRIAVDVGGVTRYAGYTSGSGSSALTFNYTPQAGDVDLDGVSLSSPVNLNGGAIADLNGNAISNLTFIPPNTANVKINYPSLSMDFVYDADGRYTLNGTAYNDLSSFLTAAGGSFTRNSVGTYFDSTGTLQTASANTPRFDHDPVTHAAKGILIEESRANLNRYSEQSDNAVYNKRNCTISVNAIVTPNGTVTADKVVEDTGSVFKELQIVNTSVSAAPYTVSAFVKPAGRNYMYLYESQTEKSVVFDLSLGTVNGNYTGGGGSLAPAYGISLVGNGWYRVWMTWNANVGIISYIAFGLRNAIGNFNSGYAGDGISGIYIWGAQLEQGAFPTSYIPTTTATVTRQIDGLTLPTGSWFNMAEGSWESQFSIPYFYSASPRLVASDSYAGTFLSLNFDTTTTFKASVYDGTGIGTVNNSLIGSVSKAASAYTSTDKYINLNGGAVISGVRSNTYPLTPTSNIFIGRSSASDQRYSGTIQGIKYYPARVSDTQLQLLTQ
ncbi:MAG TPA: hypothetical protein PKI93_04845 [Alphaproteobacteria bacterium]|nr:hypothetical protein [Alphaproteobacteria bacterium]